MSNELSNLENLSNDKIMAMVGQDASIEKTSLPRLVINYEAEDSEGNAIKRGLYKIDVDGVDIFAENVEFRPFLNAFQYKKYDEENEDNTYKSVMFKSWSDSKIDTNGTLSCGSVPKAQRENLDPVAKIEHDKVKCHRHVFGVVSLKGKTSKGEEVTLTDEPALYSVKGVNFMPIGDVLQSLSKRNKIMYNTVLKFSGTEKHSRGTVTWFTANIKDANKHVEFTKSNIETLNTFLEIFKSENDYVTQEYSKAVKGKISSQDIEDEKLLKEISA